MALYINGKKYRFNLNGVPLRTRLPSILVGSIFKVSYYEEAAAGKIEDIFYIDPISEEVFIGTSQDGFTFGLESGRLAVAFYNWNNSSQHTSSGQIFECEDLFKYDGATLTVYPAEYSLLADENRTMCDESYFQDNNIAPIIKIQLVRGNSAIDSIWKVVSG